MGYLKALKLYPAPGIPQEVDVVLWALADHEAATGNLERAIEVFSDLRQRLDAGSKTGLEAAGDLSNVYKELAGLYRRTGRIESASEVEAKRQEGIDPLAHPLVFEDPCLGQ